MFVAGVTQCATALSPGAAMLLRTPRLVALTVVGAGCCVLYAGRRIAQSLQSLSDKGLPLTYNAEAIHQFWSQHPGIVLQRLMWILAEVIPFVCQTAIAYRRGHLSKEHPAAQEAVAVQLREMLTRLGPTAIKFGQAISIRPDLLPTVFMHELQRLALALASPNCFAGPRCTSTTRLP